jgi:hypothetical protein
MKKTFLNNIECVILDMSRVIFLFDGMDYHLSSLNNNNIRNSPRLRPIMVIDPIHLGVQLAIHARSNSLCRRPTNA